MTIRENAFLIFPFIPRRFQPPPLRGTSFHGKEGECRFPMKKTYDTRIPLSRIRHFERMREIFFVRGKAKDVRIAASGKHRAPCESEERCFMQTDSRVKQKMTNEKDPSTTLGTTIRENGRSHIHFHPAAGDNLRPFGHFNKKIPPSFLDGI